MNIGEMIQRFRRCRGLTRRELGMLVGFDGQASHCRDDTATVYISKYETGDLAPDAEMLCRLATALDLPTRFFRTSKTPHGKQRASACEAARLLARWEARKAAVHAREMPMTKYLHWEMREVEQNEREGNALYVQDVCERLAFYILDGKLDMRRLPFYLRTHRAACWECYICAFRHHRHWIGSEYSQSFPETLDVLQQDIAVLPDEDERKTSLKNLHEGYKLELVQTTERLEAERNESTACRTVKKQDRAERGA